MYSMRVPEADAETRLAQPPCNPNSRKSDSQPPPVDPFPADGTRPPPAQRNQRLKIATQAVPAVKDQASHNRISRHPGSPSNGSRIRPKSLRQRGVAANKRATRSGKTSPQGQLCAYRTFQSWKLMELSPLSGTMPLFSGYAPANWEFS
jgi:hypothetical protein